MKSSIQPQIWKSVLKYSLFIPNPLVSIFQGFLMFFGLMVLTNQVQAKSKHYLGIKSKFHSAAGLVNLKDSLNKKNGLPLNSERALYYQMKSSLCVLANQNKIIPIRNVENLEIGYMGLGLNFSKAGQNIFLTSLRKYSPIHDFTGSSMDEGNFNSELRESLESLNLLIVGLHQNIGGSSQNLAISNEALNFLASLHHPKIVWAVFKGSSALYSIQNFENIILSNEDNEYSEKLAAETIFGAFSPEGTLDKTLSQKFKKGDGDHFPALDKIHSVLPEELGISSKILEKVDSIALNSIQRKVFPGCVILAMKDGKIFYEKAFGTHTYKDKTPTQVDDVFDLASVTKISSTLLGVMKVYEQGLIHLDSPLAHYLPDTRGTNKKDIILKDLLTHQSGLIPYIPFYVAAMKEKGIFEKDSSGIFTWRVADKMYERNNYFSETMWPRILESPLKNAGHFVYSDLSMYFMRAVLEKVSHEDLKTFVTNAFYKPLGLSTMGFNPRYRIPLNRIIPTEDDTLFRKQILIGDVHDPGAAMQNGVAGHAGLFSNANDLAVLGQMLLNQGQYGGRIYLRPETVKLFNTRPYPETNRRALGFDKPDMDPSKYQSVPAMASYDTFGHTGFTGTCIWVDPRNKLIFVFLSNRVNPDAGNNKITELSIRPKIHTVFYEALAQARE